MTRHATVWMLIVMLAAAGEVRADAYRVESVESPLAESAVSEQVAAAMTGTCIRVVRGESRTTAEIWLRKRLPIDQGATLSGGIQYPFEPGALVGVLRFPRRGYDFRDQQIRRGVYTLRYARQPIDGNHVGTYPTRDFLLLVSAEQDTSTEPMDQEELTEASSRAAASTHPAMLCLEKTNAPAPESLAIHHDQQRDFWIARIPAAGSGRQEELVIDLVVAGHADE